MIFGSVADFQAPSRRYVVSPMETDPISARLERGAPLGPPGLPQHVAADVNIGLSAFHGMAELGADEGEAEEGPQDAEVERAGRKG